MKTIESITRRWSVALALLWPALAGAQDAVSTAPDMEQVPPGLRELGAKTDSVPPRAPGSFFSAGPFSLHPHLAFRSVYGLGLPARGGRHVASMIQTMSPGLRVDIGSQWTFDYQPTWVAYTAEAMEDTLDHAVTLNGFGKFGEWKLKFSENYSAASPILFETGRQTKQTTWATTVSATRNLTGKLNFSTVESLNERYGETTPDTRDWSTTNWLTMAMSKQFQFGLGFGAGYSDIVARPDGTNERYLARLNWSPTEKLEFAIDGGIETRHYRTTGAKDMRNPLWNGSLIYRPFSTTSISVSTAKAVSNSFFNDQVTRSSTWTVGFDQRVLKHCYLHADYTRQQNNFDSVTTLVPVLVIPADPTLDPTIDVLPISLPGRSDRIGTYNARLGTVLLQRLSLAVTFSRSTNTSSQSDFSFTTTQYGFEARYSF